MTLVCSTFLRSVHVKIKNKLGRFVTSVWHCTLDFNIDSLDKLHFGSLNQFMVRY